MIRPESSRGARLSHAYMIVSDSESERDAVAAGLARAMVCASETGQACGNCPHCRKAAAGIHPDIIAVNRQTDEKGQARREIYVGQVRDIVADAVVLPNEAARKVYIIRDCDTMNTAAQNAMLKLLEEPPEHVRFILCTGNAAGVLDTVRSRCEQVSVNADAESGAAGSDAREYIRLASNGDELELLRFCLAREKYGNSECVQLVMDVAAELTEMMAGRSDPQSLTRRQIMSLIRLMDKARTYLQFNVGVKHVMGLLAVCSGKLD